MIQVLSARYSIEEICEALEMSRSGYYYALQRQKAPSVREQENRRLVGKIRSIHQEHLHRYGSPRIASELKEQGVGCSENRVARLMRRHGIQAKAKRAFRPRTTVVAQDDLVAPNRLQRIAPHQLEAINQVWVSDITYIRTRDKGWCYLAAIMDWKSRKIVGWALDTHMESSLIGKTLDRALACRLPAPGLFLHSDRGCHYTSRDFQERLKSLGILPSMGQTGCCYDNAGMEAFWSTLKSELLPEEGVFESLATARLCLFEYLEIYYNRKRRHSSLGYLSPENYEKSLHPSQRTSQN
jgi:transposase InsO family protein